MSGIGLVFWLLIACAALAGGLAVLHGFGKAKHTTEQLLDSYENLLQQSRELEEREQRESQRPGR